MLVQHILVVNTRFGIRSLGRIVEELYSEPQLLAGFAQGRETFKRSHGTEPYKELYNEPCKELVQAPEPCKDLNKKPYLEPYQAGVKNLKPAVKLCFTIGILIQAVLKPKQLSVLIVFCMCQNAFCCLVFLGLCYPSQKPKLKVFVGLWTRGLSWPSEIQNFELFWIGSTKAKRTGKTKKIKPRASKAMQSLGIKPKMLPQRLCLVLFWEGFSFHVLLL